MEPIIRNKVAESGIITLNLESYYPAEPVVLFDIKDYLFMGLILKEKDFRAALKEQDWSVYENQLVGIVCSADAIIPLWAYMLTVSYLQPVAKFVSLGDEAAIKTKWLLKNIEDIDAGAFTDARVVIKGCGDIPVSEDAYAAISLKLLPVVKSLMYGEPCSTVPVYKRK
ncbi:DUF2480 family protein [Niabella drilacis]|uniref:DUF2480 family protein n=1 Tax=Niabella drilacis (strain DSM 25811 / CCM 8410 / CCUG 62505 / LMG 26954 / E90) TaxID=1285928 RepID=A0A1G7C588_NIADE|nr:DUF2480 family protein [Niabella drilacis]SDE34532.1 Protein of unknown function [Niabella drilacis]